MKQNTILLLTIVFIATAFTSGCNPQTGTGGAAPYTWLDKPLPDSQYLIEPIDILAHASSPNGINALAFSVNGQLIETIPVSDRSQPLVAVPVTWTPSQPGDYLLSLTAQSSDGVWGASSEVLIHVVTALNDPIEGLLLPGDEILPPQTQEPTATAVVEVTEPSPTIESDPPTATGVPPTNTPVPPTNTPVPPTPTNTMPPADTQAPVILELEWSPVSPLEDEVIYFNVLAQDNVGVTRIDIYFVRQGGPNSGPVHSCFDSDVCEYEASDGFTWGTYTYYAIAFDAAGNQVSTFTQTVIVQEVVE